MHLPKNPSVQEMGEEKIMQTENPPLPQKNQAQSLNFFQVLKNPT